MSAAVYELMARCGLSYAAAVQPARLGNRVVK